MKDCPKMKDWKWAFPCKFEEVGETKTLALMLCMTNPISGKGTIFTMVSGFCIAADIIAMHKHGVFGQALIKKCGQY